MGFGRFLRVTFFELLELVQVAFNLCGKVIAGTKGSILGRVPSVGPFGRIGRSWSIGLLLQMGERAGQSRIIGKCHHYSTAQRFELDFNDEVTTGPRLGRYLWVASMIFTAKAIFSGTKHSQVALNLWDLASSRLGGIDSSYQLAISSIWVSRTVGRTSQRRCTRNASSNLTGLVAQRGDLSVTMVANEPKNP